MNKTCSKCHRPLKEDAYKKPENKQCIRCISAVRRAQKNNPEKERQRRKRWRIANTEKVREQIKAWRAANPRERFPIRNLLIRHFLYERDQGICQICSKPVAIEEMTLDHIIPTSKGGSTLVSNIQLAHMICNIMKSNKVA